MPPPIAHVVHLKTANIEYLSILWCSPVKLTELNGVERKTDQQRQEMLKKIGQLASQI